MNTENFDIAGALADRDFAAAFERVDALINTIRAKEEQARQQLAVINKGGKVDFDCDDYKLFTKSTNEAIQKAYKISRKTDADANFAEYWKRTCKTNPTLNPDFDDFGNYIDCAARAFLKLNTAIAELISAHARLQQPRPVAV
ncbi:hypothetical protein [Methylocaldum gracile]|jgi:hypothetical protein|uniref:hypothetical protein n=1 Tax=Methylocaldum sp. 0917 TaxID=2485163 RepID=UPI00105B24B3